MLGPCANSRSASAVSTSCRPMPVSWSSTCARAREQHLRSQRVPSLPGHERPIIEIEQHCGIVLLARFEREVVAMTVFSCDRAQPQRANIVATRHLGLAQDFRPGEYGRAGKQRRYVPAAVDGGDVESIGKPVE